MPVDLGNQQDSHLQVSAAAGQHSEAAAGHVPSAGSMGGVEPPSADIHTAANFADIAMDSADHSDSFRGTDPSVAVAASSETQLHASEHGHQRKDSSSLVLNNPNDLGEPVSKEPGDKCGSVSLAEPAAQVAAPTPQRPMTAKKAPPRTTAPAREPQRGRQGPPQEHVGITGSRQAVHVYREEASLEDDSIDVVESTPVMVQKEQESHGMLVNEMFKVMGSVEAAQGSMEGDEGLDEGINLGRSKRTKKRASARVDTGAVRDAVETLVQKIAPLARSMDYLQVCAGAAR